MTTAGNAPSISRSRKMLCVAYGAIALVALIATWTQNVAYAPDGLAFMRAFLNDVKDTPASRSFTADLMLVFLAAVIFMVVEARRRRIKYVWLYVAGGILIAISVTFPLFLIARELRARASDAPSLGLADKSLLAVIAVVTFGTVIWIELG